MGLGFTALGFLPLPEATALGYAAPLLTVIFAAMFLGEEVRIFRLSAVFFGLVGVVIVLLPNLTITSVDAASGREALGAMAALLGAVFAALAQVFVRKLIHKEATATIVFSSRSPPRSSRSAPCRSAGRCRRRGRRRSLSVPGFWADRPDPPHRELPPRPDRVIAPFEYVSMIFALVLGYTIFGEIPTGSMLLGAVLIVAAGLFIIWRERALGIRRSASRKVMTPQG